MNSRAAYAPASPARGLAAVPSAPALPQGAGYNLLLALMTVALFAVSHLLLSMMGLHYEVPGGSIIEKIHPATWLAVLAFAWALLARGHPLEWANDAVARHKGLLIFAAANGVLLWHLMLNLHLPFSMLIDTFFLPMLLVLLLGAASGRQLRMLRLAIHGLMAANALLGIFEVAANWHLTPLIIGDLVQTDDWRATALMGHPLNNAAVTAHYLIALSLGGGRDLPRPLRIGLFVLNMAALSAFGGRVAFVLAIAIIGSIAIWRLLNIAAGRRFSVSSAIFVSLAVPAAIAAVILLYDAGIFDRFLTRFVSDKGSAEARMIMLELFNAIPERDIFFGPQAEQVAALMRSKGLVGLESFWVAFILSYGLAVSLVFFAGLFAFLWDLVKSASPKALALVIFFLLEGSTSVSVSAKTTTLAMLVFIAMTMLRRDEDSGYREL